MGGLTRLLCALPAVHAAVLAINVAVQRGDAAQTMEALLHPGAMLRGLRTALAAAYQDVLRGVQREKGGRREWVRNGGLGGEGGAQLLQGWGKSVRNGGVGVFFSLLFGMWVGKRAGMQDGDSSTRRSQRRGRTSTPAA